MGRFNLYTGNRMERLIEKLAELLSSQSPSPLEEEIIIVQSRGMERWVSLALAGHMGILANVRFLFPSVFVSRLFSRLGKQNETTPTPFFEPEVIAWKILDHLPGFIESDFTELKRHLAFGENKGETPLSADQTDNPSWQKTFQLAWRLAATFEKYLLFRPELPAAWDKGHKGSPEEEWQGEIWRRLYPPEETSHPLRLLDKLKNTLKNEGVAPLHLPERLTIFGIPSLAPFYLDIFHRLSEHLELNVFFLNPSGEYWIDILSKKEMGRQLLKIQERHPASHLTPDELYMEEGNSLLASYGAQGRDYLSILLDLSPEMWDLSCPPGEESMLQCLQDDLFSLRERGKGGLPKTALRPNDRSIQIHCCHSPLREVEVLHDQLLALFEEDRKLKPHEILVMTPDIDVYAPFIEAVFTSSGKDPSGGSKNIPYSLADRTARSLSGLIKAFFQILDLAEGRYKSGDVLSLLELEEVRNRFALTAAEVTLIRTWQRETKIHWGIDEKHKGRLGLPAIHENTWMAGLERLFLGYALPGEDRQLFAGILPYDHLEGLTGETLGKFTSFLQTIFSQTADLNRSRPLGEWSETLKRLSNLFFVADDSRSWDQLFSLTRSFDRLAQVASDAEFHRPVDIDTVRYYLSLLLDDRSEFGFLSRGVTFCALRPMRSIPFKVICLLGMNFDAFPAHTPALGFDLLLKRPRKGDPSRRQDDRYLFLETILSARQCLYISYIGQSSEDNSPLPPSTPVSELLDYLEQGFFHPEMPLREHLVTRHRLQAFSPSYFSDEPQPSSGGEGSRLFSYSRENCEAAVTLVKGNRSRKCFIDYDLHAEASQDKTVTIRELRDFYRHPVRYFAQRRLGIFFGGQEEPPVETEVLHPTGLDHYALDQAIFAGRRSGLEGTELFNMIKARGILPHGNWGKVIFQQREEFLEPLLNRFRRYTNHPPLPPLCVELPGEDFHLSGEIGDLYPWGRLEYTLRDADGRNHLPAWICHVILNVVTKSSGHLPHHGEKVGLCRITTLLIDPGTLWRYTPPADPEEELNKIVRFYREGLRKPLPLFGRSSWEYAKRVFFQHESPDKARRRAESIWQGNDYSPGEGADPYLKLCFGTSPPFQEEFSHTSEEVFRTLTAHLIEEKDG